MHCMLAVMLAFRLCWFLIPVPWKKKYTVPQWSNAAHMLNMTSFASGKLPGNSKTVSKSQKIKPFLEREALNVEYLWKSSKFFVYL